MRGGAITTCTLITMAGMDWVAAGASKIVGICALCACILVKGVTGVAGEGTGAAMAKV